MFNVCCQCGVYRADKIIASDGSIAICPECGHQHPFRRLPLLLVSGASGAGKSTVCHALLGRSLEVVLLDSDILWRPEFNMPADNYRSFFETWLRMCKNIGQAGQPVVLFGAGVGVPANLEPCVERRYFSKTHYLALTCEDEQLVERLKHRPVWRQTHSLEYQSEHVQFNNWFKAQASQSVPAIELIDTTAMPVEDTTEYVTTWIRAKICAPNNAPTK